MKNLHQILRGLMDEMQLSESELARRTHVGQPVIHRILSGETDNPRVATLSQIANYFSVSISQLIGDVPLPPDRLPGTHQQSPQTWTQVPLLNWEQVLVWPKQRESIQAPVMIGTDLTVSKNAFALRVKDTTMMPRFLEGMLLIADPEKPVHDRGFAILRQTGQKTAIFKQILKDSADTYLKALNPDFKTILMDEARYQFIATLVQARDDLYPQSSGTRDIKS
ncbi:MAG: helix-turn-helix domain-containing protein [Gammaproteobacteria bacterium]|nr:helix-turn-helix domain-containing protein [Gammaproteobacteria bacterium]